MNGFIAVTTLAALLFLPLRAAAFSITINPDGLTSQTSILVTGDEVRDFFGSVPHASDLSLTGPNGSSGTVVSDLSTSGFYFSFEHSRADVDAEVSESVASITFSIDQDVDYIAAGRYSVVDEAGSSGSVTLLSGRLSDETAGTVVFYSRQLSMTLIDPTYTLGGSDATYSNDFEGSLIGTLVAGHQYEFFYDAGSVAGLAGSTGGASGSGFFSLQFTPEPGTGVLVGLGLAGLAQARRRLQATVR